MFVKICGLSNIMDAMTAADYGASALGFVMGGRVLPAEVEPHAQTVRDIIRLLPDGIDTFVVTHLLEPEDILALADYVGSSGIQISEDIGLDKLKLIRKSTTKKIIKTVVATDLSSISKLKSYESCCDFILLDSQVAGYVGGTGFANDFWLCGSIIRDAEKPVYLAGGLTPDNVADAIRIARPQGVDVSTGVSTFGAAYLRKDRKDPDKIKAFITNSRSMIENAVS